MSAPNATTDTTTAMVLSHRLREVWWQRFIPVVVWRGRGKPLALRMPYDPTNRKWLTIYGRRNPIWNRDERHWELPASWFNELVEDALRRWGELYVIQPYREQEKCAPACWNAKGHICECSCMGKNHGSGHPGGKWFIVSDTFASRWEDEAWACRLLTRVTEAPKSGS